MAGHDSGYHSRMHRDALLDLLAHYRDRYPEESETIERCIDFVRANERCFDRALSTGHVTGSGWLVSSDHQKVLLTHHRKLDKWLQLGGHADSDPDPLRVALREAAEESGLTDLQPVFPEIFDLDIHPIRARSDAPAHFHYDARFAIRATAGHEFTLSGESHDLAWIDIVDLENVTQEPSMLRMKRKWLQRMALYRKGSSAR